MSRWILPILFFLSQAVLATEVDVAPVASAAEAATVESHASQALKETEIPVHLEAAKKGAGNESPWMRMLGGLAVVGILSLGSYLFIKKTKGINRTSSQAPEIKVLAQHYLGPKKSLAIIRVAGESILLGVTENNINMIKSLSLLDEDIPETVPSNFESVFSSTATDDEPAVLQKNKTKTKLDEDEEFSISGIKDVVTSRLKNMRTFQ